MKPKAVNGLVDSECLSFAGPSPQDPRSILSLELEIFVVEYLVRGLVEHCIVAFNGAARCILRMEDVMDQETWDSAHQDLILLAAVSFVDFRSLDLFFRIF